MKLGQHYFCVAVDEIAYFFYHNRVTFLKTWKKNVYFIDYILYEPEVMLSPCTFFRANRLYLLHINSVKDIHPDPNNKLHLTIQPTTDEDVLVSRDRAPEFKEWMGEVRGVPFGKTASKVNWCSL